MLCVDLLQQLLSMFLALHLESCHVLKVQQLVRFGMVYTYQKERHFEKLWFCLLLISYAYS